MLDAWIIEQIRKDREKQEENQPVVQIDLPRPTIEEKPSQSDEQRGIIIIDL